MSDETKPQPEWGIKLSAYICIPQRVIMSFLAFFGCVNCYAMRICLSMAMPALVIPRNYSNENLSEHHHCPPSEHLFENDSPVRYINNMLCVSKLMCYY
ncbi:hypothetical protein DOY81_001705 [Sarcophaga bullata]|nr:hypothetical protein DOY81_001705 [Sarcophaga bullata]